MTSRDNTDRSPNTSVATPSTVATDEARPDLAGTGTAVGKADAHSTVADVQRRAHASAVADRAKNTAGDLAQTVRRPIPVAAALAGIAATAGAVLGVRRRRRAANTPKARLRRLLTKLPYHR
jgi:hypothetical protein